MKKLIPLFALLSACAGSHIQSVPVYIHCLTPDQYKRLVDAEPKKIGNEPSAGDVYHDYERSVKQNILVRQYADGLLTVLGTCIGPVQTHAS